MLILADLHVHIYPSYSPEQALLGACQRFTELSKFCDVNKHLYILALTERHDCNFFKELSIGQFKFENFRTTNLQQCVLLERAGARVLIFPGRQLNTVEGVELLSLGQDQCIASRQPLIATLQEIEKMQAVPVINWAPGKWWFKRGQIIKSAIVNYQGKLLLGDTSLRPKGYPIPLLMKLGQLHQRKVIYGSDPLPDQEEQDLVATYISRYNADFDLDQPLVSFRKLLLEHTAQAVGARSNFFNLAKRMWRYYR